MESKRLHVRFISKSRLPNSLFKPRDLDPITISCLYKLYPLLLLFDQLLDKLMWHVDDIPLQILYIIMSCYLVAMILPKDSSLLFKAFDIWLGYMCFLLLSASFIYYNSTLLRELDKNEAPTLDEVTHTLESVLDKVNIMQEEVLGSNKSRKFDKFNMKTFKLVILLTLVHVPLTILLGTRSYVTFCILFMSVYHSVYYQSTMKLFWRYLWLRRLYYFIWDNEATSSSPTLGKSQNYKLISESQMIPFPKSLQGLRGQELQIQLQMLIVQDPTTIDPESDYIHVKIVEYNIDENERKWKQEGWTPKLLPYERSHFCNSFTLMETNSPWKFQEELTNGWIWVDANWFPENWIYCDAQWNSLGANDSIACFTRKRTWKRRAFKILQ